MSVVHWMIDGGYLNRCGTYGASSLSDVGYVTCRLCLNVKTDYAPAVAYRIAARIAALDAAQVPPQQQFDAYSYFDTGGAYKVFDTKKLATKKPAIVINSRVINVSLLTRLSDFIANLPSGALDRKTNAVAMQLRREIADLVCPADKERK